MFRKRVADPPVAAEPAATEPASTENAPTETGDPPEPEAPPIRVVLVDDDPELRELMEMGLTRGGLDVVGQAADGAAALDLVEQAQPDIVLLDLHMPDVGGLEVLPALRAASPRSKFVVVSAIGATHMLEATLDAGAAAFIEKGVSIRSILVHLDRVAHSGAIKVVRPYPLNREYPERD